MNMENNSYEEVAVKLKMRVDVGLSKGYKINKRTLNLY
jgi:hypothetical protein